LEKTNQQTVGRSLKKSLRNIKKETLTITDKNWRSRRKCHCSNISNL